MYTFNVLYTGKHWKHTQKTCKPLNLLHLRDPHQDRQNKRHGKEADKTGHSRQFCSTGQQYASHPDSSPSRLQRIGTGQPCLPCPHMGCPLCIDQVQSERQQSSLPGTEDEDCTCRLIDCDELEAATVAYMYYTCSRFEDNVGMPWSEHRRRMACGCLDENHGRSFVDRILGSQWLDIPAHHYDVLSFPSLSLQHACRIMPCGLNSARLHREPRFIPFVLPTTLLLLKAACGRQGPRPYTIRLRVQRGCRQV